jgi:hypothetical protein
MSCNPGHQSFRRQFFAEEFEHLLLEIDGVDLSVLAHSPGEGTGEKARTAADVEYPVSWLKVTFGEPVRSVDVSTEPAVKVPGPGGGEDLTAAGDDRTFWGRHEVIIGRSGIKLPSKRREPAMGRASVAGAEVLVRIDPNEQSRKGGALFLVKGLPDSLW